jgi:hypothetical protein
MVEEVKYIKIWKNDIIHHYQLTKYTNLKEVAEEYNQYKYEDIFRVERMDKEILDNKIAEIKRDSKIKELESKIERKENELGRLEGELLDLEEDLNRLKNNKDLG